ncbi:hypothetical protein [Flavobacterium sp.]|uniref:hypothetical protein n=1 Tax=Flavobacterium sp. TaxID=239 RepID=UPI0035281156
MKKIISIIVLFTPIIIFSQVSIGKASVDGDGILDFENPARGGIILPAVTTLPTGTAATNGTIIYDYNNGCVKIRQNNAWENLTPKVGDTSTINLNTATDSGNGVVIGTNPATADGVLVLESNSKALILPRIDQPHLNLVNPHPGTMCYDTYNKALAVFDGSKWYFYK